MTADVLLKAAAAIRKEQDVEESLGHISMREYTAWLAVADWLHDCGSAPGWEQTDLSWLFEDALAVARAYLGIDEPIPYTLTDKAPA